MARIWRAAQHPAITVLGTLMLIAGLVAYLTTRVQVDAYEGGDDVLVTTTGECLVQRRTGHSTCDATWEVDGKTVEGVLESPDGPRRPGGRYEAYARADRAYTEIPSDAEMTAHSIGPPVAWVGGGLIVLSVPARLLGRRRRAVLKRGPVPPAVGAVAAEAGLGDRVATAEAGTWLVYVFTHGLVDTRRPVAVRWTDITGVRHSVRFPERGSIVLTFYEVDVGDRHFADYGDAPDLALLRAAIEAGLPPGRWTERVGGVHPRSTERRWRRA